MTPETKARLQIDQKGGFKTEVPVR